MSCEQPSPSDRQTRWESNLSLYVRALCSRRDLATFTFLAFLSLILTIQSAHRNGVSMPLLSVYPHAFVRTGRTYVYRLLYYGS